MPPVAYLRCGLTGSGKTTYAKRLEAGGAVRHANAMPLLPTDLEDFIARFEEPTGEGEELVESRCRTT